MVLGPTTVILSAEFALMGQEFNLDNPRESLLPLDYLFGLFPKGSYPLLLGDFANIYQANLPDFAAAASTSAQKVCAMPNLCFTLAAAPPGLPVRSCPR